MTNEKCVKLNIFDIFFSAVHVLYVLSRLFTCYNNIFINEFFSDQRKRNEHYYKSLINITVEIKYLENTVKENEKKNLLRASLLISFYSS